MDAQEINNILTSHWATRGTFIGTFPCDMLPESINQKVFGLVVNTKTTLNPEVIGWLFTLPPRLAQLNILTAME